MKYRSLFILALLLGVVGNVCAQEARNGTNAAAQLMVPIDARSLGGGGAAAMSRGIEGVLWNPAAVDRASGDVQLMVSRRNYIADMGINFAALGYSFGDLGSFALHLRSFDIGTIEETSEFYMDGTGETFRPTFFTLGATYSREMTDRISIGVTSNLVYESFVNVSTSGVTFDAGVQYQDFLNLSGLRIGAAIRNIGTSMQYDGSALFVDASDPSANRSQTKYKISATDADVPTVVDLSVGYRPVNSLDLSMTYRENTYAPSEVRGHAEYHFLDYLDVRVAYMLPTQADGELENIREGYALGGSLNLQPVLGSNLSLDYGYMPLQYFEANHLFTLRGSL